MKHFRDRVAVVTGAGSGIGRATSLELAARGCALALVDIDEAGARQTARLVEGLGRRASTHVVDVADEQAMRRLAGRVAKEHGRVNIVVNNAGVGVGAPFEDHSLEDFQWIVGINFWGAVHGCKFFLPYLKKQDEAHIVNISSAAGLVGISGLSSYCATKFAVYGLSQSLRLELAPYGIGVTSVHPGAIKTNIVKTSRYSGNGGAKEFKRMGERLMERIGRPPEVAAKKIVGGIAGNQARVLIGSEAYLIDALKRYAPRQSEATLAWIDRRLTGWEGRRVEQ